MNAGKLGLAVALVVMYAVAVPNYLCVVHWLRLYQCFVLHLEDSRSLLRDALSVMSRRLSGDGLKLA